MRASFCLVLLGSLALVACGSSSNGGGGSSGADGKAGGDSSGGKGSGGADSGDAGDTGTGVGGKVDVPVVSAAKPHAAGGLVAGGTVAHSKNFTGVFTLGAAPGGNGVSTSAKSQLRGGVIGASQK